MKKGKSTVAPDYFHHLGEDEWNRLTVLHVPVKMMKEAGEDTRQWMQYKVGKRLAQERARTEFNEESLKELQEADRRHYLIYQAAARIEGILKNKEHYILLEKGGAAVKQQSGDSKPRSRLDVFQKMVRAAQVGSCSWGTV